MPFQKKLKSFVLTAIALYLTTLIIPGFSIGSGLSGVLIATLALALLNIFAKPLVKLLLLPVNLVTLGAFRWLASIVILYLLAFLITQVTISNFNINQIPALGKFLPNLNLNRFFATILISININLTQSLLSWLIR